MLDLNISTILLEMANFLILAFILYRFLFTPLQKTLNKRAEETTRSWDEANAAKAEAEQIKQEYEEKSHNIDAEITARKNEARIVIEQTRQQMLQEVQTEIESIESQTKETLSQMRTKALQQHRDEIGNLAAEFVTKIISDIATPKLQKIYRDEFLNQINETDLTTLMKDALPGESGLVKVITPTQPTNAYKEQLESKLQESYPKKLEILYEEDPSLIAGGILQFETELIDGSLQGQIEQLKQKYEQKV